MLDNNVQHNIIMEGRSILTITGVNEINSFDLNNVVANTNMGELTIKGNNLHINNLNVDTGELNMEGEVVALFYNASKDKNSILSKIFK